MYPEKDSNPHRMIRSHEFYPLNDLGNLPEQKDSNLQNPDPKSGAYTSSTKEANKQFTSELATSNGFNINTLPIDLT